MDNLLIGCLLPSSICGRGHCLSVMTDGMKVCGAATTTVLLSRSDRMGCRVFNSMFSKRTWMSSFVLLAKKRKNSPPMLDFDALEAEFILKGEGLGAPVLTSNSKSSRDKNKRRNKKSDKHNERQSETRNARPISAKKTKLSFEGLGGMSAFVTFKHHSCVQLHVVIQWTEEEADAIVLPTFISKASSGQEGEEIKTVARTIGAQRVPEEKMRVKKAQLRRTQSATDDENYFERISETVKNEVDTKCRVSKGSEGGEDEVEEETIEEKMRKTRPPASIRILNSIPQPDFVSVRLENVAVAFKNQEVGLLMLYIQ